MIERILDIYTDNNFILVNGYNDAIIGVDDHGFRLIYSVKKTLDILESQGMEHDDALDHFYFNLYGAYLGENGPIWCQDNF
jgi:hypothetical protein